MPCETQFLLFLDINEMFTKIYNRRIVDHKMQSNVNLETCFMKCTQEVSWCRSFSFFSAPKLNVCIIADLTLTNLVKSDGLALSQGYTTYISK